MAIIEVNRVSKEFRLGQLHSFKESLRNLAARLQGRPVEKQPPFKALDDIDFKVQPGEVLGIIGHNGAGKSTLLKILAGISQPSRGSVKVRGRVAPLIEVGAGLLPDFTGRENVYLNAAILGMKRREIRRKFDEIVAFAELEQFVDTPVKRYSSGMQVRLGFSIATAIESEILIVDEVLAVGDLAFQRKCFDRMEELITRQGRTVLIVSHDVRQVARICHRALLMEHGRVLADGKPQEVCKAFYALSDAKIYDAQNKLQASTWNRATSSGEIELTAIAVEDADGRETQEVAHLGTMTVAMTFKVKRAVARPLFGIGFHTTDLLYLATHYSSPQQSPDVLVEGVYEVRCVVRDFPLLPGMYSLRVGVAVGDKFDAAYHLDNAYPFKVVSPQLGRAGRDASEGFVALDASWRLPDALSDSDLRSPRERLATRRLSA